jgi:hypothetical protein
MTNLLCVVSVLLVLNSCQSSIKNNPSAELESNQVEKISSTSKIEFNQYLKSLDTIPLPFEICMESDIPALSKNFDKELYKKYRLSETSYPLGILFRSKKNVVVLDLREDNSKSSMDENIPILISFDAYGNLIDSLTLYKKSDADITYYGIEWVTVFANRKIVVCDTTTEWEYDEEQGDRIWDSYTTTTGKTFYEITKDGKIIFK